MTKRIIVDPITRIEGHLRIEVIVDENNVITDAYSSSTLWRGLEVIVKTATLEMSVLWCKESAVFAHFHITKPELPQ